LLDHFLEGLAGKVCAVHQTVELGDIGGMVLAVVVFESFLGDMGLKSIEAVG